MQVFDINKCLLGVKPKWTEIIQYSIGPHVETIKMVLSAPVLTFPLQENIFEAFKYFDVPDLKVVILGQDCYIGYKVVDSIIIPQANGIAFSVNAKTKIPPSLKNIYKECNSAINEDESFVFERWVKQGVLMLNSALTVFEGQSNSHSKYWQPVTDYIIKEISNQTNGVVFILWGNFAKTKIPLIDKKKHCIIEGVHPSPLSAKPNKSGDITSFFGHNYFNRTNIYLESKGKNKIIW